MKIEGKYRLIMVRTKYLKNSLDLTKNIFHKAYVSFMSDLSDNLGVKKQVPTEQDSDISTKSNLNQKTEQEANDEVEPTTKKEKDENLKNVFRQIARIAHPDKLEGLPEFEREYKTSLFERARNALENNDYYVIVEVAEELNIEPPPPTKSQIEIMKKTNSDLEKEIDRIQNTLVWGWYHAEDEKKKKGLMEKYIEYIDKKHLRP
jgi:hypothetical protein